MNAAGHAFAVLARMPGGAREAGKTYHEPYRSYHISDGWHYHGWLPAMGPPYWVAC